MTASTEILQFAGGGSANVLSQSAYAALTSVLANGYPAGILPSTYLNKTLRQANFMAAGLAAFCVAQGVSVPDDGNLSNLVTELETAITTYVNSTIATVPGGFKNLKGVWSSNTTATFTASSIVVAGGGSTYLLANYSQVLTTTVSGAGGLDTGSIANNTPYYVHAIYNPTSSTKSALMSLSATSPTLPSGYTASTLIGSVLIDGSGHIIGFIQDGADVQFVVGQNLSNLPLIASGTVGNVSTPTYASASLSLLPANIKRVRGFANPGATTGQMEIIVAPNNSYGSYLSTSNPPPVMTASSTGVTPPNAPFDFIVESSNIYWASSSASYLYLTGYRNAI